MQTESDKEQEGWEVIDEHSASWDFIIEVQRKDNEYRLKGSQPAMMEDIYVELSSCPKHSLEELNNLPKKKYKSLLGTEDYGGFSLRGIAEVLGVQVVGEFSRKNCSSFI